MYDKFVEMEKQIERAKNKLNQVYFDNREWTSVRLKVPGWSDGSYDLELISRLGSPCKGYIIANYGTCTVRAFDSGNIPRGIFRLKL